MGTKFICCFHWNSVNDYGVFIWHFMCDTPKYRNLYSSLGTGKCGSRELCLEVMVWHFGWTVSNLRVTLSLWKPGAIRCYWDFCNLQSVVALKTVRPLFLLWPNIGIVKHFLHHDLTLSAFMKFKMMISPKDPWLILAKTSSWSPFPSGMQPMKTWNIQMLFSDI